MAAPPDTNPPCPICEKQMRLVGIERHTTVPDAELLTFECACGQVVAIPTKQ